MGQRPDFVGAKRHCRSWDRNPAAHCGQAVCACVRGRLPCPPMCREGRNDLVIEGPERTLVELRRRLQGRTSAVDFERVLPIPSRVQGLTRVRWCLEHWGSPIATPANARVLDEGRTDVLAYSFTTPSRAPVAVMHELARLFPALAITLIYEPQARLGERSYMWRQGHHASADHAAWVATARRCGEARRTQRTAPSRRVCRRGARYPIHPSRRRRSRLLGGSAPRRGAPVLARHAGGRSPLGKVRR